MPVGPRPSLSPRARSYGWRRAAVQIAVAALIGATSVAPAHAQAPVKIVAFGDSLTAGYGLPDKDTSLFTGACTAGSIGNEHGVLYCIAPMDKADGRAVPGG